MAYTDVAAVQLYLGRTLSDDQQAQVDALIPAAQSWIDARSGHAWDVSAPIADETHYLYGPQVSLDLAPVAAVTSVKVRDTCVGATDTTLTVNEGYEVRSLTGGTLYLPGYTGWLAKVSYTPAVPLDARIGLAATMLVAAWLRPALDGITGDVQSYRIGQDLQVTYSDPATGAVRGVPDDVVALVDQCRRGLPVFA